MQNSYNTGCWNEARHTLADSLSMPWTQHSTLPWQAGTFHDGVVDHEAQRAGHAVVPPPPPEVLQAGGQVGLVKVRLHPQQ